MKKLCVFFVVSFLVLSCSPSPQQLKEVLAANPDIILDVIKNNPAQFVETINVAFQHAQLRKQQDQMRELAAEREGEFKNPKKPEVLAERAIAGSNSAPITIVEYSDFQCPYCSRGYDTIKKVQQKYGDRVRVIYKHLPLENHPLAMPAAKYFEAIALQDTKKAYQFHDKLFENQDKLNIQKEKYLESVAQALGINMKKLKQDLNSEIVRKRIEADAVEARKFSFTGTPGFLVNGVSIRGAYPLSEFESVIERHLASK
ncbi:MAG TPA: thioredoxin domain-containing protein [Bdellovibrionota bacterium]|nr:thioredoxin domain-containing protein [Bdellovibrionota bacterium]